MTKLSTFGLTKAIAQQLMARHYRCATAESCTGGLVAAELTKIPGSSSWFDCSVVTYSNAAKTQFLGVPPSLLLHYGAVSQETATAMAQGILTRGSQVDFCIAITGLAGPGGGTLTQPVGTVWFAWASRFLPIETACHHLTGNRTQIRKACVAIALTGLLNQITLT